MLFSLASPLWLIALSLIVAVAATGGLYWRNRKDELDRKWRICLSAIRFGFVFLVCFLLLSPLVKIQKEEISKPVCYLSLDQSYSMRGALNPLYREGPQRPDSSFTECEFSESFRKNILALEKRLSRDFLVQRVGFAQKAEAGFDFSFDRQGTDFQQLFSFLENSARKETNACAVLVSDGNANLGMSPLQAYRNCAFPLFCIGVGDTSLYPDLFIGQVQHNPYAYKGNTFPVRIQIGKTLVEDGICQLKISCQGKIIKQEEFDLGKDPEPEWDIPAEETGIFRYDIEISPLPNEKNLKNNRFSFTVRILEDQRRILILAQSPHPDISTLSQSLTEFGKYRIRTLACSKGKTLDLDADTLEEADLVVLHGLPSITETLSGYSSPLKKKNLWIILSPSTSIPAFNRIGSGLQVQLQGNTWDEAQALFNRQAGLFELDESEISRIEEFPPLYVPFAHYKENEGGQSVFFQKVLQTPTSHPLIHISRQPRRSVLVSCGQGFWRWRMAEFQEKGNTRTFDRIIDRLVQLSCSEGPKENLIIHCPENVSSTQRLEVRAELYNASFEKVRQAEIHFRIRNEENGKEYEFDFFPEADGYRLDAGTLPEGAYTYLASCKQGAHTYLRQGKFLIQSFLMEDPQLPSRIEELRNLSLTYPGAFFYAGSSQDPQPQAWDSLYEEIRKRKDLKPQIRYGETLVSLLDRKIVLIVLLGLACMEYLLRKIFGNL